MEKEFETNGSYTLLSLIEQVQDTGKPPSSKKINNKRKGPVRHTKATPTMSSKKSVVFHPNPVITKQLSVFFK